MRLSPHFTLEEFWHSETALRLGIDNTPPLEVVDRLRETANGMEQMRAALDDSPILVSSGYRCEMLERVICSKDFRAWAARRGRIADEKAWAEYFAGKAHPKGYAIDWTSPRAGSPRQIVVRLANSAIAFDQLIMEGTWVHASFDPQMRRDVKTATFVNGTPHYTNGVK